MIKICQLACGFKPLTKNTIGNFNGLENIKDFEFIIDRFTKKVSGLRFYIKKV